MPTIAEQLAQLAQIKADIKAAIEAKGETVGSDALSTYATHISNISSGGGGGDEDLKKLIDGSMTTLVIPNGTTTIRDYAFYHMDTITSVTIPTGVTKIGNYAFSYCDSITSITIPNGTTEIGISAFRYCTYLSQIEIASSVTSITTQAFQSCQRLSTIICKAQTPPTVNSNSFGSSASNYTGRNTYNQGVNKLYVPQGCSSAYNTSYWASVLLDATKCGFTIAELDANGNIPT